MFHNSKRYMGYFLYVAHSHMTKKALNNAQIKLKKAVKTIQKHQCIQNVWRFNTIVMDFSRF